MEADFQYITEYIVNWTQLTCCKTKPGGRGKIFLDITLFLYTTHFTLSTL